MLLDAGPFLPPLARRLASGEHADLLAPYRLVDPTVGSSLPRPALEDEAVGRRRSPLAAALAARNRELGHPGADALAARLEDPATQVVITGQQPGLFGGPLYSLSKLLAALRWAETLESESRAPAVALFWMATEDHDFAEVARCAAPLGPGGELVDLALPDDGQELVPVGRRVLGPGVEALLERLREAATSDRQRAWADRLGELYAPERTFGEAFAALMIELLGPRCPLFVDALDPAFKAIQAEVLTELIARRSDVGAALGERDAEIGRRGLPHQVAPQPAECSPLFLLDDSGRRCRILWEASNARPGFTVRGGDLAGRVEDLLGILEREPVRVGPGALARPVVQDALFGTTAFLVGPGELSYLTQASALYSVLGVTAPAVALRPQMLLLDERRQTHLAEMMGRGLEPALVLGSDEEVERILAEASGDDPLAPGIDAVLEAVDGLREPATAVDPQLESAWTKTRSQVERALEALQGRTRSARARSDEVLRQRVEALRGLCLPGGGLQERKVAVGYFPGLYGDDLAIRLLAQLELAAGSIQLLDPSAAVDGESPQADASSDRRGEPAAASER